MDYVECVTFSLQIGVFFLMQCFWNYLSNTVAKKSFMSSWEFRLYIIWALCSMAMFPILQWVYRDDVEKREIIPQLAYGSIIKRLSYFKDMNLMVIVVITCYASSFIILCVDGLTEAKIINSNKFATDALIANANICSIFLWLCLISIFHPRPQYTRKLVESTQNESTFRYSTSRQQKDEDRSSNHIHTSGRPLSPQSQFSYQHGNHTRSLAIEDPYSSEPVMFSMMDISSAKQQYHEGLSNDIYSYTSGHQQSKLATATTVAPQRIRRPSWEAYHTTNYSPQFTQAGEQQMVQDWLRQSPNRRNA
ncbi:hypothetical protein BDF20DRAFT_977668 [Mycotypha africana]|uniref:uncharacterized protein n=1 Tax=Mycotypha africana TaxID=64632 RepID=UPI0023001A23|nr:uncharacterized protein BDF20DRAFT_977668 [Mycotypha africana]KAI8973347.1 hypothetical protein BDF20DRAFT_977668 [Mycotypha africana]